MHTWNSCDVQKSRVKAVLVLRTQLLSLTTHILDGTGESARHTAAKAVTQVGVYLLRPFVHPLVALC